MHQPASISHLFSDNELLLEVYSNEDFEKMMEKDIVRYSDDPTDFDYIWPEAFIPNSKIINIVPLRGCGTISNLKGLDIHFLNGTKLCIRFSDLVIGTMSSWIEEYRTAIVACTPGCILLILLKLHIIPICCVHYRYQP